MTLSCCAAHHEPQAAAGGAGKKSGAKVEVEQVQKQLDALTADERTAAVLADAPELASLLEELTAALHEVGASGHRVCFGPCTCPCL